MFVHLHAFVFVLCFACVLNVCWCSRVLCVVVYCSCCTCVLCFFFACVLCVVVRVLCVRFACLHDVLWCCVFVCVVCVVLHVLFAIMIYVRCLCLFLNLLRRLHN